MNLNDIEVPHHGGTPSEMLRDLAKFLDNFDNISDNLRVIEGKHAGKTVSEALYSLNANDRTMQSDVRWLADYLDNNNVAINDPDSYVGPDGVEVTKTVDSIGTIRWKNLQGKLHRVDGPAVIYSSGTEYWYKDDLLHREDGPAITYPDGRVEYWIEGKKIAADSSSSYIGSDGVEITKTVDSDGTIHWKNSQGLYHRVDGPAVIYPSGTKFWYKDGKRHRLDGPAVVWFDGSEYWYKDDLLHREDGPAVIWSDGEVEYWIEGKKITADDLNSYIGPDGVKVTKTVDSLGTTYWKNLQGLRHRVDGPAVVNHDGTELWYKDGKLHREGRPSIIYPNGAEYWHKDGLLHREDGPAVILSNDAEKWFKNGLLHREDGPAIIWSSGAEYWYKDDKLHREDGPAVTHPDGTEYWYKDGLLHRVDGPAVIRYGGSVKFYLNGKKVENVLIDNLWNKIDNKR